jgi:fibronectin-binding autotransporter adhesin
VWTGDIALTGATSVGVDADRLLLSGAISGAFALAKILPGTLEFGGGTPNTNTGVTVNQGTLILNKAIADAAVTAGALIIGNDTGGNNADVVQIGTGAAPEQIADTVPISITSSGRLNLNNNTETVGATTLFFGPTFSGNLETGIGEAKLNGNVTVSQVATTVLVATSPSATITGNLNLGGAARTFNVALNAFAQREADISATVNSGGAGGAIIKTGAGSLALTANNSGTYTGTTQLQAGAIVVGHNNALGTGTLDVNTAAGTIRAITGGGPKAIANAVTLNNNLTVGGVENFTFGGPLTNAAGNRTLTFNLNRAASGTVAGTVNLSNDATNRTLTITNNTFGGGVTAGITGGDVTVTGQIVNGGGSTTGALTKLGTGLVILTNNANDYDGLTTVNGGILRVTASSSGSNSPLGSTTGATTVTTGSLQLDGDLILNEALTLNANGFGNFGAVWLLDTNPAGSLLNNPVEN